MAEEEFSVVVADNGSGTRNTEFAGDDAPRVELPSIIDRPKTPGIMVDTEQKDSNVGDDVQSKRGVSTVKRRVCDFSLLCENPNIKPHHRRAFGHAGGAAQEEQGWRRRAL